MEVLDENDNSPVSDELVYYGSVLEDSPPGIAVLKVSATDADLDPHQKITFNIIGGNEGGYFIISNETGSVITNLTRLVL